MTGERAGESFEAVLQRNGLAAASGKVLEARWEARTGDWWHRTAAGWFWWDARKREWKPAAYGP